MIDHVIDRHLVSRALKRSRVVALLGARQCAKTTLARAVVLADSQNYFDLEDPAGLARLAEPDLTLRPLRGIVVIDEIQRRPDLFPLLRVLADRRPVRAGPRIRARSSTYACSRTENASAWNANAATARP